MSKLYGKREAEETFTPCTKRGRVSAGENHESYITSVGEVSGNDREQPVADFANCFANTEPTPAQYCGKMSLQPEELLLYCLVKLVATNGNINLTKGFTAEKYFGITQAVYNVCGVRFDCANLQNYFYRSTNNLTKGLGKYHGYLRWKFYSNYIERIISTHQTLLLQSLVQTQSSEFSNRPCKYDELNRDLENECLSCLEDSKLSQSLAYKITKVSANLASRFPKWKIIPSVKESNVYLYYMGNSTVNVQYQVTVLSDGSYSFIFMGQPKSLNFDRSVIPPAVHDKNQLCSLMKYLEKFHLCPGVSVENYQDFIPDSDNIPLYKTSNGEPAAFVESVPGDLSKKLVRSTKCDILINGTCCSGCLNTSHYLRTLKSRSTKRSHNSKYTRFDYMFKDELLEHSREMAGKLHIMQNKIRRLEEYQRQMSTVGTNTDSDFRMLFQQLYKGLNKVVEKHNNNTCYWHSCHLETEFESPEILLQHIKAVHIETVDDVAPIDRQYFCEWLGCHKHFGKKKLLHAHVVEHTGSESDTFFITLLNDQAKALNMPSKQMRWHPSVLKWCLRMYCKSRSAYSELRESGFLKLPSGRTLSDYKNFCSSKSGWQLSVLEAMRNIFLDKKIPEAGKFGGLFFDEVKIKEGLLFDPSSWELIGFTDLHIDDTGPVTPTMQASLATHVLQFFYKSLFADFQFPCSYFLTRGISAQNLNRIFWQGVSLLHCYNFEIILTCCDGASENRTFMTINGCSETNSQTTNPFSKLPLFFISDPPHLIKKLRNNLYSSGYKEHSSRYTRCLLLGSKNILWDHIYSVYLRDKQRHLFSTDLRSSHVHLDNLSKMRVKLAVQALNSKVRKDMEKFESDVTLSTQKFILNCERLWNVFNDNKPLSSITDSRIKDLENVLHFFNNWKDELASQFTTKSEISQHFITWQTMFDLQVNPRLQ